MPRLPRVYIEGILYYVTAKGGHNQVVFADTTDYREYINLINDYKKQYGFKLFAYALLPTHLHMLIEVKNNIPISKIMHDINSRYTKLHNARYAKKGHLFEARFKSLFAEKESFLLRLVRHIHLNPVRMGLAGGARDYPYSSHLQYLDAQNRQQPDLREEVEECFALLGGREDEFEKYVATIAQKQLREFEKYLHKRRVVGSKDFIKQTKRLIEKEQIRLKESRVLSRRARIIFVAVVCAAVLLTTFTIDYFYRRSQTIRSEYDKTLTRYQAALNMLMKERDKALQTREDIETFQWQIELVENALQELEKEKEQALQEQKAIAGYKWRIRLEQIGGPKAEYDQWDTISITATHISSHNLMQEGFGRSRYSRRETKSGTAVWETIQSNQKGDRASWRGEWDGELMKGFLRKSLADGTVWDFSFVSSGERTEL